MTTQATTAEMAQETTQGFSYARLQQEHAAATAALGQFGKAIKDSGLSPQLTELVKVRFTEKRLRILSAISCESGAFAERAAGTARSTGNPAGIAFVQCRKSRADMD
jgi:hypothetical protein